MDGPDKLPLFERAVTASTNSIVITDPNRPDDPLVYVNPAFEKTTGYSMEEVVGLNCRFLQGEDRDQPPLEELRTSIREGRHCTVVLRNYRKDGTRFWNELSVYPVRDEEGRLTNFVGVQNDVTERKRAEEERERLRAEVEEARTRLAFFAGAREERQMISRELHDRVAHSMAVVRQCLELHEALKDRTPENAAAKLEQAKEEAKSALQATRDLSMMLRRSEIGGGLGKALSVPLHTTVPPDVRYEVGVEGDEAAVPPHVGNQLFLILREAVRNAVSHSGCGRISLHLDVVPEEITGTVEDDGSGFDPEGSATGGAGLKSMKERTALVGGACSVLSEPNAGTRVQVSIPLAQER